MRHKLFHLVAVGLICITGGVGAMAEPQAAADQPPWNTTAIGNEIPAPADYTGLSRKVLQYMEAFNEIVEKIKEPGFSDEDWAPLEELVDIENFERKGVFLGDEAEVIGWEKYREYITKFAGDQAWESTLRRITEVPGLVVLELEERTTINGVTDASNTVTIYEFNDAGKLTHLDAYVMPLP